MENDTKKVFDKKQKKGLSGLRVLYAVILIVIISLIFINSYVYFIWLKGFTDNLRIQSVNYLFTQAKRAAEGIGNSAGKQTQDIETLAYNLSIFYGNKDDSDNFVNYFIKQNPDFREVSVVGLDGKELDSYSRDRSLPVDFSRNFGYLEPFEKAKKGETFISRVEYSDYSEPFVIITTPIRNSSEETPKAVLFANYYLKGLWENVFEVKIGETGKILVVDDKGMLIADPQPSRVLKKINLLNDAPPVKEILSGRDFLGTKYNNEKKVEVFGVGTPIKIENMNWGVVVEENASEIEAPLSGVTRQLQILVAGNLVIALLLIWIMFILRKAGRKISQQYENLENETERLDKQTKMLIRREMKISEINDQLLKEREKISAIVSNFLDPIIVLDKDDKISLLNPSAKKVFGMTDFDLGQPINPSNAFSMENFKKVIRTEFSVSRQEKVKGSYDEELELGNKNQKITYKVITASVLTDKKEILGTMKIFYDLTREKALDALKSEFISVAAHQLRTPLSTIKWVIKMILDGDLGKLNTEQKDFLQKGYKSNERVIQLVNDLLDVSRIEEGRFGLNLLRCNFKEVLDVAIENIQRLISQHHVELLLKIPKELPLIYIDKEKMILVMQNILDNSVKYTPEYGKIEIGLTVRKNRFQVLIRDNGVGIPQKDQVKLFSKFFRASNVVRMETDGNGLGLFIVRNIIEMHGGEIKLASQEGMGTEIVFTLPLTQ